MKRLVPTAEMTLGPFFPREFAQGADDLTRDSADGERIEIIGRVTQLDGRPLDNLVLEIRQTDSRGRYDNNRWDNRRAALTFTYRFSKGQNAAPQQRRRTGSSQEEQNRVGGGQQ